MRNPILGLGLLVLSIPVTHADIVGVDLGTAAPPATLGGIGVSPFPPNPEIPFTAVSSVDSPLGGKVDFSLPLTLRLVGQQWSTWSHDYTGDVYYTDGALSVSLTLPSNTTAFYLYAEPNMFESFDITVEGTDDQGTSSASLTRSVFGRGGANGYGFYADNGQTLKSIQVSSTSDFAIGEFGIGESSGPRDVPEIDAVSGTGALVLVSGIMSLSRGRRRRTAA